MSRPWLRPHDSKFYLRKRTPARYRKVAGRAEFRIPLNTRDPKEAKARVPQALAVWADMEAEWERALARVTLDEPGAQALVQRWFSHLRRSGDPMDFGFTGLLEPTSMPSVDLSSSELRASVALRHAQEAIRIEEAEVTEGSVRLVAHALEPWLDLLYSPRFWLEITQGRGFAVPRLVKDPVFRAMLGTDEAAGVRERPLSPAAPEPSMDRPVVTFDKVWERWSKVTATAPRTVHETKGILKQLGAFLGHEDAARVVKADLVRWRDALKADGKSNNTWNNRLSLIAQVFKLAVKDDLVPTDPTVGLRLDKGQQNPWKPYSDEDTLAILLTARQENSPALRWAHWVMALSGMRVGEVLQLTGDDIAQDPRSGVWFMAVKHDIKNGKAAKNSLPRHVPMHPSLIEEGFLAYVQGVKENRGDAPIFPDKKPDKYGRLGGRAWNLVGLWVREKVGITDKDKAPNHSWRHRMEDELRTAEVDESVRDAIIGHARKTVGAKYGVKGEALARLNRELSKVQLPVGL